MKKWKFKRAVETALEWKTALRTEFAIRNIKNKNTGIKVFDNKDYIKELVIRLRIARAYINSPKNRANGWFDFRLRDNIPLLKAQKRTQKGF